MTKLQDMKPAERKKRIAALIKNPGTRSAVADKFLPPAMRKQRELNTRLKAPVVEGSAVTVGDLARQRKSASALKYGAPESQLAQQLAGSMQQQRDTSGWYEQYKQELAAHQANTAAIGAQEQAQMQQFGNAVTGLDQSQLNATTQASVADAATRGTVPGADAAVQMGQGSAVRQALLGSFGAMMAGQSGDANRYADTLSHVVAPGQKLQGQAVAAGRTAKVRQSQTDLAKEKGSFEQQFEDEFKQNESKNVLAGQIAGVKSQQEQQKIDIAGKALQVNAKDKTARVQETAKARRSRERIASDRNTLSDAQFQAKYGETKRHNKAMEANAAKKKKKDAAGGGPDWQTPGQQGTGASDATNLKDLASKARTGQPFVAGHAKGKPMSRQEAVKKIQQSAKVRDPVLLSAALDAAYDGHISPATVKRLINAGYKPSTIAQALGVPTGVKGRNAPRPSPTTSRPAANYVPVVGRGGGNR